MRKGSSILDSYFPGCLDPGRTVPFMHRGEWAVHSVIPELLARTGPADVRLMSYNVSEDSLRTLFFEERIRSLKMILDINVKRHKMDLLLFASEITPDIRVDSSHAKVLLIENGSMRFGIAGSANLNLAHRYESGFWFTAGPAYDYFREQFDSIFESSLPYDTTQPD